MSPGSDVKAIHCDVSSSASVAALADTIKSQFRRLDVVVSNPAFVGPVTLKVTEGDPAWFQQNFSVNVVGTYHAAHHLIPLLLESSDGAKAFVVVGSFAGCVLAGPIA